MTRGRYRQETESQRLETLIQYRRRPRRGSDATDEVYEIQRCVVCKTNPRVIVLWPCRYLCPLPLFPLFFSLLCSVVNAVDALRCVTSVDRYWLFEISVNVLVVERKSRVIRGFLSLRLLFVIEGIASISFMCKQ